MIQEDVVGRRRLGCLAVAASLPLAVLGVLFFVANALADIDRGTYCESIDHPGKCSDPLELIVPGTALIILGGLSLWFGVTRVRGPRAARSGPTPAPVRPGEPEERRPWSRWLSSD